MALDKHNRWLVPLLLAFFALKGLFWAFVVPLANAPDEPAHFDYVNWLIQDRRPSAVRDRNSVVSEKLLLLTHGLWEVERIDEFTVRRERYAIPLEEFRDYGYSFTSNMVLGEGGQPPLYYLVAGIVTLPVRPFAGVLGQWHAVRVVSVAFGVLAVFAAIRLGTRHEALRDGAWFIFPALILATHPMLGFVTSVVNNDGALIGLSAVLFAMVALGAPNRAIAVTLGALLVTKASAIALIPWWFLWVGLGLWRKDRREFARCFELVFAPLVVVMLYTYMLRGQISYLSFVEDNFPEFLGKRPFLDSLSDWSYGTFHRVWLQFGGVYGWADVTLPPVWHMARAAITMGLGGLLYHRLKRVSTPLPEADRRLLLQSVSFVGLWLALLVVGGTKAMMWAEHTTLQGRMALPCLLPLAVIGALTLKHAARLSHAWKERLCYLIPAAGLLASTHGLLMVVAWDQLNTASQVLTPAGFASFVMQAAGGRPDFFNDVRVFGAFAVIAIAAHFIALGWAGSQMAGRRGIALMLALGWFVTYVHAG